ncbi:MAG TPA: YciI family protein [Polyangiaceae bacterium]|jgi:hypothetical protein|nr:YciI family protein [Polyangiaceae bacterium]
MRFMIMHKVDANMEAGGPPSPQIIQGMGALVQESLKNNVFLTGAGLHRSAKRARLTCRAGECSLEHGPYAGKNELLASFAMITAKSLADATEHARKYARARGDVELEIGLVVEPWDLGVMPKPSGEVAQRYLLLIKADADFERGISAQPAHEAALAELQRSLGADGALLASDTLAPSSKGARLSPAGSGKRTWVDGPFAETKELIAGFSILEVPSKEAALAWADRYAAVLGDNQVDVRVLA